MKAHLDSISVNGIELFYKLEGSDSATDWITLLNGYSRTHSDFNIISRSLASSGYKVLTRLITEDLVGQSETAHSHLRR